MSGSVGSHHLTGPLICRSDGFDGGNVLKRDHLNMFGQCIVWSSAEEVERHARDETEAGIKNLHFPPVRKAKAEWDKGCVIQFGS